MGLWTYLKPGAYRMTFVEMRVILAPRLHHHDQRSKSLVDLARRFA